MRIALAAVLAALVVAPGCVRGGASGDRPVVVVGAYPFRYLVEEVAGGRVELVDVVPPGAEPHDVELSPTQVGQVEQADLVVLARGFQPALDAAAPDGRTVDALATQPDAPDPHVWLDPLTFAELARRVGTRLGEIDPEHREEYRVDADGFVALLESLHQRTTTTLDGCAGQRLVTGHAAFGWFADRYDLEQTGITGVDAEAEPSPRRLADVVALVKEHDVPAVFADAPGDRAVETVAREAGVAVRVFDPVEVAPAQGSYFSVMDRNVETLADALDCE